jgi:hypothetical protein
MKHEQELTTSTNTEVGHGPNRSRLGRIPNIVATLGGALLSDKIREAYLNNLTQKAIETLNWLNTPGLVDRSIKGQNFYDGNFDPIKEALERASLLQTNLLGDLLLGIRVVTVGLTRNTERSRGLRAATILWDGLVGASIRYSPNLLLAVLEGQDISAIQKGILAIGVIGIFETTIQAGMIVKKMTAEEAKRKQKREERARRMAQRGQENNISGPITRTPLGRGFHKKIDGLAAKAQLYLWRTQNQRVRESEKKYKEPPKEQAASPMIKNK